MHLSLCSYCFYSSIIISFAWPSRCSHKDETCGWSKLTLIVYAKVSIWTKHLKEVASNKQEGTRETRILISLWSPKQDNYYAYGNAYCLNWIFISVSLYFVYYKMKESLHGSLLLSQKQKVEGEESDSAPLEAKVIRQFPQNQPVADGGQNKPRLSKDLLAGVTYISTKSELSKYRSFCVTLKSLWLLCRYLVSHPHNFLYVL